MTNLEKEVLATLEQYGHKRRCMCYHLNCLVIPWPVMKHLIHALLFPDPEHTTTKKEGGEKDD